MGGNGGRGGHIVGESLEPVALGGTGGLGGFGGLGGAGVAFTGSYTNVSAEPLLVYVAPGANGAPGAVGTAGADGANVSVYDETDAEDGGNGSLGAAGAVGISSVIAIAGVGPIVEAAGGFGGAGGSFGFGGTGAIFPDGDGDDGDDGKSGFDGADGVAPDPLPAGWTLIPNDGNPRIVFSAAQDPAPPPPPVFDTAPFSPLVPDQSDTTAGSVPGVIEFSNLPAGAVVSVSPDAGQVFKGVGSVTVVNNVVTVTPDKGFSGVIKFPVSVTIGGRVTVVDLTITVNPAPAPSGQFSPTQSGQWWPSPRATSGTTIVWDPSENATGYEVWLVLKSASGRSAQSESRVLLCTATSTSCSVDRLVGRSSTLELVATGNDGTRSTSTLPTYRSATFTRALNVMFGADSSRLTAMSRVELDLLAFVILTEGFREVHITSHISSNVSSRSGRNLSLNRARAVSQYLSRLVGTDVKVTFESLVNVRPVASNNTTAGREANRRVEVSLR